MANDAKLHRLWPVTGITLLLGSGTLWVKKGIISRKHKKKSPSVGWYGRRPSAPGCGQSRGSVEPAVRKGCQVTTRSRSCQREALIKTSKHFGNRKEPLPLPGYQRETWECLGSCRKFWKYRRSGIWNRARLLTSLGSGPHIETWWRCAFSGSQESLRV